MQTRGNTNTTLRHIIIIIITMYNEFIFLVILMNQIHVFPTNCFVNHQALATYKNMLANHIRFRLFKRNMYIFVDYCRAGSSQAESACFRKVKMLSAPYLSTQCRRLIYKRLNAYKRSPAVVRVRSRFQAHVCVTRHYASLKMSSCDINMINISMCTL